MGPRSGRGLPGRVLLSVAASAASGCTAGPGSAGSAAVALEPVLRIAGDAPQGELGFRFGPPRDVDGDGISDLAGGERFAGPEGSQAGAASIWSGAGGRKLAEWRGDAPGALLGQAVLLGPDADGDGSPDIIASAPNGRVEGIFRGVVTAHSSRSGRAIWRREGEPGATFGWHLALAGDHDGDGLEDVLAGAPNTDRPGKAYLLSGRDGSVLRSFESGERDDLFGWHVSSVGDLDGDRRPDVLAGAPSARRGGVVAGAAFALSSADGRVIHAWDGRVEHGEHGQVVRGLGDLDGDGFPEVGVGAPSRALPGERPRSAGEVHVFSGRSGALRFRWSGRSAGELYGRIIADAGDLDGDGTDDVAVGAPWHSPGGMEKAGRFEVRSGKDGAVIAEVLGDRADGWLGWHIEAGDGLGRDRSRGLVVSALRSAEGGRPGAGALIVFVPVSDGL